MLVEGARRMAQARAQLSIPLNGFASVEYLNRMESRILSIPLNGFVDPVADM